MPPGCGTKSASRAQLGPKELRSGRGLCSSPSASQNTALQAVGHVFFEGGRGALKVLGYAVRVDSISHVRE